MFGSVVLEVGIGLGFVYLILSLICSTVQELIARIFALRSRSLHEGIKNLLEDPNQKDLTERVYQHPLVKTLARHGKKPSYIPARNFCVALLDVLKDPGAAGGPLSEAQNTVGNLKPGPLRDMLSALIGDSGTQIDEIRRTLEGWFDDSMDRVGGWYKRKAQTISILIASFLAIGLNVDSIRVAGELWSNPTVREEYVALAEQEMSQALSDLQQKRIGELSSQLNSLPIGWPIASRSQTEPETMLVFKTIGGWLLTAFAVSLGAPFWFDALSKLVNFRSTGRVPKKSQS